jgi:hypothetical protein
MKSPPENPQALSHNTKMGLNFYQNLNSDVLEFQFSITLAF